MKTNDTSATRRIRPRTPKTHITTAPNAQSLPTARRKRRRTRLSAWKRGKSKGANFWTHCPGQLFSSVWTASARSLGETGGAGTFFRQRQKFFALGIFKTADVWKASKDRQWGGSYLPIPSEKRRD